MRLHLLLLAVVLMALVIDTSGEKIRKHKKYRVHKKEKTPLPEEKENAAEDDIAMLEDDEKAEKEEEKEDAADEAVVGGYDEIPTDPCADMICGAGRECTIDEKGIAKCDCVRFCQLENDPRRKVCSNHNETWDSDCDLHKMRCLCKKGAPECSSADYGHVHIEYYGECRDMPECTADEMLDFPRRMRDWLFNIMRDLADRRELSSHYLKMEREAESDQSQKWANAAVWKWCELDDHPHDRVVSRHELFPIRAPLLALEHCIGPFLDSCDSNHDHFVTLEEWGSCLQLEPSELADKCEEIREDDSQDEFNDDNQPPMVA